MRLGKVLEDAGVRYCLNFGDVEILSVTDDSRRVRAGGLFVAVPGCKADGHTYLRDALARGAAAVAVEDAACAGRGWPVKVPVAVVSDARRAASRAAANFHRHPARRVRVVGVTGTNGKTTVTHYLRSVLGAAGYPTGLVGTLGHDVGTRTAPARNTTPGPVELHALLREMETHGRTFAAMEVSSHALHQGRVADIPFAGGVFTNLAADHLDYHGTRSEYLKAKSILFRSLGPEALAVLNADDWASVAFSGSCKARKVRYGTAADADLRYRVLSADLVRTRIFLTWRDRPVGEVQLRLPGLHNAANAAAAAAFALGARLDEGAVVKGLEALDAVPGRLEPVSINAPFKVFVDYAHTEDALKAVLESLKAVHGGRILLVFGCGGDRDRTKRPRMGRVAGALADQCWITSDNPRSEDPAGIIREIENGMPLDAWYSVEPDREKAIRDALGFAGPGDAVLVAGKGHETTQTIGDQVRLFDDRRSVERAWQCIGGERGTQILLSAARFSSTA